jgi:hypothetical protein
MLSTRTCMTAGCDQCGQDCFDDADFEPHWPINTAALTDLANLGWQVNGTRLTCRGCVAVMACQAHGHPFSAWWECGCEQRIVDHPAGPGGQCAMQWRSCQRCEHHEQRPVRGDGQGVA